MAHRGVVGSEEVSAPAPGSGLPGRYFNNNNKKLTGAPVLTRIEAVDFNWGAAAPGPGVLTDLFSTRWTGTFEVSATGRDPPALEATRASTCVAVPVDKRYAN